MFIYYSDSWRNRVIESHKNVLFFSTNQTGGAPDIRGWAVSGAEYNLQTSILSSLNFFRKMVVLKHN